VTAIKNGVTVTAVHVENPKDVRERHISSLTRFVGEPANVEAEDHWEIDAIRGERKYRGRTQYLVHFRGYSDEHNEWKDAQDIAAPELVGAWQEERARETRDNQPGKVHVARVFQSKRAGRYWKYLVAESEDMGPEDYQWVLEREVDNPELLREFASGGGVVGAQ
jgi:hypothetical protein